MNHLNKIALLTLITCLTAYHTHAQNQSDTKSQLDGDLITLSVENVKVTALLKMLATSRRLNIVAAPDVQGQVSVNLYDVPFQDALNAILEVGGFAWYKKGNVIMVATRDAIETTLESRTQNQVSVYTLEHISPTEASNMIAEFLSDEGSVAITDNRKLVIMDTPQNLAVFDRLITEIDVQQDTIGVIELAHILPEDALTVVTPFLTETGTAVITAGRQIVIRDSPNTINSIYEILNALDIPPRQVLITSKILTISHTDDQTLGIDMSRVISDATGGIEESFFTNGFTPNITGNPEDTILSGAFGRISHGDTDAFIQALADKSDFELLASPQLLVLDGKLAKIQVGDRLGYRQTLTTQTSSLESVEFLDVGTVLEVTPSITRDGLIELHIKPEVSTGTIGLDGLPQERTTQVDTTMLIQDGETIVLGGLLDGRRERTRKQVPLLGDIPLLGLFFGRNTWIERKIELIIMITPNIVGPNFDDSMIEQAEKMDTVEATIQNIQSFGNDKEGKKFRNSISKPSKRLKQGKS